MIGPGRLSTRVKVPPGAPTIGTATGGITQGTANWTAPTFLGNTAITGYSVKTYRASDNVLLDTDAVGDVLTFTNTGQTAGVGIYFRVEAINAAGTSAQSGNSNTVTPTSASTVPDAPTIGTATFGNTQAVANWTAPANNGGSAITGYTVKTYRTSDNVEIFSDTVGVVLTFTRTGLTNGLSIYFKVAAINAIGTGSQSAASNSVVPATVPGAPTIGSATPGNSSVNVTWTAPASNGGSAITGYTFYTYNDANVLQATDNLGVVTSYNKTGLTNGTSYYFRVAAVNAVGQGANSADTGTVVPNVVPNAPSIGTATHGDTQATANWSTPSNSGTAITGYDVKVHLASNNSLHSTNAVGVQNAYTKTGLTNGVGYYFIVAAKNSMGNGPDSAASNTVTPAVAGPSAPSAPQNVDLNGDGVGGLTGTWSAPASNGGASIIQYEYVIYNNSGEYEQTTGYTSSFGFTSAADTPGDNMQFWVRAQNSAGWGPYAFSNTWNS